jgi:class 3 adenylate cyclase
LTSKDGRLIDWGGELTAYGIDGLDRGQFLGDRVLFLAGMLPFRGPSLFLPCVGTGSGLTADIHIFPGDEGDWILLLDATNEEMQRGLAQQASNELNLLRHKLARAIDRCLKSGGGAEAAGELLLLPESGERRDVSFLVARVKGFTSYCETECAAMTLKTLDQYLRTIVDTVIAEGGWLDKILGDAVMALFGVFPAASAPPYQAAKAALRMLEEVEKLNELRHLEHQVNFKVGIGIGSGPVTLGIIGSNRRRTINAIGHTVDLAARLEHQSRPNEILIDAATFQNTEELQSRFAQIALSADADEGPTLAFSSRVIG